MVILGYFAAILIGLSIGLIGAGGSILAVPIFVYLFGIEAGLATSYSLFVVGTTALIGGYQHYRIGNLRLKTAVAFAIPSVLTLLLVRKYVLPIIPQNITLAPDIAISKDAMLMIVFALLMIFASVSMIRPKAAGSSSTQPSMLRLIIIGLLVGIVTGFLGAGGGFLIIPALLLFGGLPIKQAVGTSLFIIFINAYIGFAGDVLAGITIDYALLAAVTAVAVVGIFIGVFLSRKITAAQLKPLFGWFVLLMGIYIIAKELLF